MLCSDFRRTPLVGNGNKRPGLGKVVGAFKSYGASTEVIATGKTRLLLKKRPSEMCNDGLFRFEVGLFPTPSARSGTALRSLSEVNAFNFGRGAFFRVVASSLSTKRARPSREFPGLARLVLRCPPLKHIFPETQKHGIAYKKKASFLNHSPTQSTDQYPSCFCSISI